MLYQLPTGKVIRISIEQYLDLTDDDIAYLCNPANNIGVYAKSLWTGSALKNKTKSIEEDNSIDFVEDDEELRPNSIVTEEELLDEDFPDESDESPEY